MARKSNAAAEIGDNLTEEERERAWLLFYYDALRKQTVLCDRAKAAMKAENDKRTELFRSAKADAKFSREELAALLEDGGLSQTVLTAKEERRNRFKSWLGQPVGAQGDLFAGMPTEVQDEAHAKGVGYEMGLRGDPCELPETLQPRFAQAFGEGYHKGQEELAWALSAVGKIVDRRKDAVAKPVALEPEPEPADEEAELDAAARKLKREGWTQPTADEGAFEPA